MKIDGQSLTIYDVVKVALDKEEVQLSREAREHTEKSREYVDGIIENHEVVYGITTGFGKFCDVIISKEDTKNLQVNLIRSHSAGVGEYFSEEIVRAMMLLRINALAKGYSGIRFSTLETLVNMLNQGVIPLVPSQGSLGASGDLVPLAHMVLVMLGEGEAIYQGEILPGKKALERAGIPVVVLEAKEGLALINGTQAMTAVGSLALAEALHLVNTADYCAALTFEALRGVIDAFDESVHLVRPHRGQIQCAKALRALLQGSDFISRQGQLKVQDAYTLRCIPQVHGAIRDALDHVKKILEVEINSATDNPLIFPHQGKVISSGNFHGEPIAINMDYMSIAVSELANISERRIERLVNPSLSEGLPAFLIDNGGLHSGLMIAQYTAASLVSENKTLAHPASVDSIPSSANQEDHVSMGTIAARKALKIVENTRNVLAIELLAASQGIDLRRKKEGYQLQLGQGTRPIYEAVRSKVDPITEDRIFSENIAQLACLIKGRKLAKVQKGLSQGQ